MATSSGVPSSMPSRYFGFTITVGLDPTGELFVADSASDRTVD
jgi:hypothetical protein